MTVLKKNVNLADNKNIKNENFSIDFIIDAPNNDLN